MRFGRLNRMISFNLHSISIQLKLKLKLKSLLTHCITCCDSSGILYVFFSVFFNCCTNQSNVWCVDRQRGGRWRGRVDSVNVCDKRCQLLQRSHILDLLIYSNWNSILILIGELVAQLCPRQSCSSPPPASLLCDYNLTPISTKRVTDEYRSIVALPLPHLH